jgi:glutathione S-transferase
MKLYYNPRSSYSQKTLMAFHEKGVSFTPEIVNLADADARARYAAVTPIGKVPLLVLDNGWKIPESSIIIEYLDGHFPDAPRLIPEDRDLARQTRFHDRIADLYCNEPMTKLAFDAMKPADQRDPAACAAARTRLDAMFAGFDEHLARRTWLMGDTFTMADCALIPVLGYCRQLHPFDRWKNLTAYAGRGFERPSYRKVAEELAPYLAARASA